MLVLTRPGADSAGSAEAVRTLGNVTLLERPLRVATLVSAVRTRAARARAAVPDSRASRGARAGRGIAPARRPAQGRVPRHARPRAAQSAGAAADGAAAAAGDRDAGPGRARVSAVMERQVKHLVRLVDDLLEVSRITRGMIEVQPRAARSHGRSRAAVDTSRPDSTAAGHELSVELPREPVVVVRRRRAAHPGVREPAHQRREVHQRRRSHLGSP